MNIVQIAQLTGTISIFILFCINLWIVSSEKKFQQSGRVVIVWLTVYGFFTFIVRLISFLKFADLDQLRIISGFAALIPLVMVIVHLLINRNIEIEMKKPNIPKIFFFMITISLFITFLVQTTVATPLAKKCNDFVTQKDAQEFYETNQQKSLDRDRDGIACEDLP